MVSEKSFGFGFVQILGIVTHCRQVRDVECQELFDKIHFVEDITILRAPWLLENRLEPIRLKKTRFQQNKHISPTTSSKAASITLSMATYLLSWVTFTLHQAHYLLSAIASTILSAVTDILSWATYTTSFTFIVILTTLCCVTSNPKLSILLTFILLFVICLKLECGKRSKRRKLRYLSCCFLGYYCAVLTALKTVLVQESYSNFLLMFFSCPEQLNRRPCHSLTH